MFGQKLIVFRIIVKDLRDSKMRDGQFVSSDGRQSGWLWYTSSSGRMSGRRRHDALQALRASWPQLSAPHGRALLGRPPVIGAIDTLVNSFHCKVRGAWGGVRLAWFRDDMLFRA